MRVDYDYSSCYFLVSMKVKNAIVAYINTVDEENGGCVENVESIEISSIF